MAVLLLTACVKTGEPIAADSAPEAITSAMAVEPAAPPISVPPLVEGRAVWVVRSHYRSADDVRTIMRNCAEAGFNQVLFQVRGNATVFYRSEIEPWAWELSGGGPENLGKDPGWDPLAVAVEEAHRHGLELHAWVNVYPAWQGADWPPPGTPQLWNRHPEWFMKWKNGSQMLPYYMNEGRKVVWYSFINPAHPEVNPYLLRVFSELVRNYAVDGLHMDYIRYPHDLRGWDFSYDEISLSRFKEATGKTPEEDSEAWSRWRGDRVTELVRMLNKELKTLRPGLALTAAVAGDADHGLHNKQFTPEWIKEGLLDAVILMNYQTNDEAYRRNIRERVAISQGLPVYSGMGPYRFERNENAADQFRNQMRIAKEEGAAGVCQFSYVTIFGGPQQPNPFAEILKKEFYGQPARSPMKNKK